MTLWGLSACDSGQEPEEGADNVEVVEPTEDPESGLSQEIDLTGEPAPEERDADGLGELPPVEDPRTPIGESADAEKSTPPTVAEASWDISSPGQPDGGSLENDTYTSDFFGFRIDLPDQWYPAPPSEFQNLSRQGSDLIEDESAATGEREDANYRLLIVSKLPFETEESTNPSIIIVAEKVGEDTSAEQYLQDLDQLLSESLISYVRRGEITTEQRGPVTFQIADYKIETAERELLQSYIITLRKGYALSFIITDTSVASLSALREFVLNAEFEGLE
jgi:hypothetical protein